MITRVRKIVIPVARFGSRVLPATKAAPKETDAMAELLKEQQFFACRFEGESHDCSDKLGWLKANIAFAGDRNEFSDELKAFMQAQLG